MIKQVIPQHLYTIILTDYDCILSCGELVNEISHNVFNTCTDQTQSNKDLQYPESDLTGLLKSASIK